MYKPEESLKLVDDTIVTSDGTTISLDDIKSVTAVEVKYLGSYVGMMYNEEEDIVQTKCQMFDLILDNGKHLFTKMMFTTFIDENFKDHYTETTKILNEKEIENFHSSQYFAMLHIGCCETFDRQFIIISNADSIMMVFIPDIYAYAIRAMRTANENNSASEPYAMRDVANIFTYGNTIEITKKETIHHGCTAVSSILKYEDVPNKFGDNDFLLTSTISYDDTDVHFGTYFDPIKNKMCMHILTEI